jgi:hypothetical protein
MTTNERPAHIINNCDGPNAKCRAAHKRGVTTHIIPPWSPDDMDKRVVLPTHHFFDEKAARDALADAVANAPIVTCDEDLYRFRAEGIAYKLPVGWTDPTRR